VQARLGRLLLEEEARRVLVRDVRGLEVAAEEGD